MHAQRVFWEYGFNQGGVTPPGFNKTNVRHRINVVSIGLPSTTPLVESLMLWAQFLNLSLFIS